VCAKKIAELIQSEYNLPVSREEIIYLALHIERLLNAV
ncbi:PRD domain-containing protein, partial [Providencia rettgeri]|nr:PRD domain-containing protein [Providencia rettgeri]